MGEITIVDFARRHKGGPIGSEKVVRLDPAAVGKAIHRHAVPRLSFTDKLDVIYGIDKMRALAVGAPNASNLDRTSAYVRILSDGNEARFEGNGPTLAESDYSSRIELDDRLSPRTPVYVEPVNTPARPNPLWVAPWRDSEMLGQAVLTVLGLARAPIGKGMMPSIFDPMEPKRRTALHRAARDGNFDALPQKGSRSWRKIDPVDTAAITPLMLASENGHIEVVERLLELGANPNAQDHEGCTPLHNAAGAGRHEVVDRLLEGGADPSAPDHYGHTPLHLAAAGGFLESVEILLRSGASPAVTDAMYLSTPLHLAAKGNHTGVTALLVNSGSSVNAPNEAGRTALHVAAAYGHIEAVRALIEVGADLNYRDDCGETPLYRPVFFQHMKVIALLTKHGASVTSKDEEGNTPLHIAASMNRDAAARVLLDSGADVEAVNHEGLTALDLAITNQHREDAMEHNSEVAEVLLEYGATIVPERLPIGDRHALWPHLTPKELLLETGGH